MKKIYGILLFVCCALTVFANSDSGPDTSEVIKLNKSAMKNRLTKPDQTIADADKALQIAIKIGYDKGTAEAYRIKGIGQYYLNHPDSASNLYFQALEYYKKLNDERGQATVYNNMGNLYQLIDYDKALYYFDLAKDIAIKYNDKELIAKLYLNKGNIYNREYKYTDALDSYKKAHALFTVLKDPVNLVLCLMDIGDIYSSFHKLDTAKNILIQANQQAKILNLNSAIARINMTLTGIYIAEGNYKEAENYISEGMQYARLIQNKRDISDYKHAAYELELKQKNYEKALNLLMDIYKSDSTDYKSTVSTKLSLQQKENEHIVKDAVDKKSAEFSKKIFFAMTGMAGSLIVVIVLLISNVKRKATTNVQLKELNSEISRQKDNLDRINHHLEEIIDERTKDLQIKNKKLSEYSSYLSHQIRGPIATLKGLMNLEKEGLVDQVECISMMDKCVSEIDDKIIEMSDMLHDPGKPGFAIPTPIN